MTLQTTLDLLTGIGTILLAIAAFVGMFYPKIEAKLNGPRLKTKGILEDDGKSGLSIQVENIGKSPSHNTIATISVITDKGRKLGTWTPPWKIYSDGFPGVSNGLKEATYTGITIYPMQIVNLYVFSLIRNSKKKTVNIMGLNAPPYLIGFDANPSIYWRTDEYDGISDEFLKSYDVYSVVVNVYSEELSKPIVSFLQVKWDMSRKMIVIV